MTTISSALSQSEILARELEQDPAFRIVRKFDGSTLFREAAVPPDAGVALILDTETTGKGEGDRIIELGMVSFAYNRNTGEVYRALESFNALEDPGIPIEPEATAIHGLTDDMVAGKSIDDGQVRAMVELADVVIAHNAQFDRGYCESRFSIFRDAAWACSMTQVDWRASDITSAKLEYIAYKQGFFYSAHRAENDCLALLNALQLPLAGGANALSQILQRYYQASRRIWATNSPFETKDVLKARGYRWSDGMKEDTEKAWFKEFSEDALEPELEFLKREVYRNKPLALPVDTVDAFSRFSSRRGLAERLYR